MARFHLLFRCVGDALAANGVKCLLGLVPFGERLYEIAQDACQRYKEHRQIEDSLQEVEAAAQASSEEVRAEARLVFQEVRAAAAPDLALQLADPAVEQGLVSYLEQVPAAVRCSLRRPADPSGRTGPPGFSLRSPDDFLRLLPARPARFRAGDRPVSHWQLEELLGVGGFGEVWKARHPTLRSLTAALKFCLDEPSARFLRHEAGLIDRLMAQSRLPGVVELRNTYLENDPPCLEYEFVPGGDLSGLLHDWVSLEPAERAARATRLIGRLAVILAPLHRRNPPIVHRDLKPANVMLVRKEGDEFDVKVTDFGLGGVAARQALAGATKGVSRGDLLSQSLRGSHTPLYASPEQTWGGEPDPRDDVHALGVMWYQLLVGDSRRGVGADVDEELRELGVADDVVGLVRRCVARAERRWADAGVLGEKVQAVVSRLSAASAPTVPVSPPLVVPRPPALTRKEGPHSPTEQLDVEVLIPGNWYARLAAAPDDAEWGGPTVTPGKVMLRSGLVCKFEVHKDVDDAALAGLVNLQKLASLQSLDLRWCIGLTDAGLAHLRGLTSLQSLNLVGCNGLTNAGLAHLGGLTSLRSLDLWGCNGLTDAGLAHLGGLTSLQSLDLRRCNGLTNAGLAHLGGLTSLQSLDLTLCSGLTDAGLAHLRGLTSLQSLNLAGCNGLTDAGLAHLGGLTSLQSLDLALCSGLTDAGLAHLRGLTSLQSLDLCCIGLTDAGLAHLGGLTSLQSLNLAGCNGLTDAGLAHLRGLTSLQSLNLAGCNGLTDAGLAHLRGLTSLQTLDLPSSDGLTDVGVAALRKALPSLGIGRENGD